MFLSTPLAEQVVPIVVQLFPVLKRLKILISLKIASIILFLYIRELVHPLHFHFPVTRVRSVPWHSIDLTCNPN
ncbi:MAG: hypothetical protein JWQ30_2652 [Sediminibacterium sp.]|nr:hypothetical protein [Sediminibacterium sp.]